MDKYYGRRTMSKEEYIVNVLTTLNEIDVDGDYSSVEVRKYIEELFPTAWRRAVEGLPASWFHAEEYPYMPVVLIVDGDDTYPIGTFPEQLMNGMIPIARWGGGVGYLLHAYQTINNDGTGYIVMPSDFLKLSSMKLRGWRKSVYEVGLMTAEEAFKQSNRYTRGTPYRPKVFLDTGDFSFYMPVMGGSGEALPKGKDGYNAKALDFHKKLIEVGGDVFGDKRYQSKGDFERVVDEVGKSFNTHIHTIKLDKGDVSGYTRNQVPVLRYFSLDEGARRQNHDLVDFKYIPTLTELPDQLKVTSLLCEALLYVGAMVALEVMELWESARAVESKLAMIVNGVR